MNAWLWNLNILLVSMNNIHLLKVLFKKFIIVGLFDSEIVFATYYCFVSLYGSKTFVDVMGASLHLKGSLAERDCPHFSSYLVILSQLRLLSVFHVCFLVDFLTFFFCIDHLVLSYPYHMDRFLLQCRLLIVSLQNLPLLSRENYRIEL